MLKDDGFEISIFDKRKINKDDRPQTGYGRGNYRPRGQQDGEWRGQNRGGRGEYKGRGERGRGDRGRGGDRGRRGDRGRGDGEKGRGRGYRPKNIDYENRSNASEHSNSSN